MSPSRPGDTAEAAATSQVGPSPTGEAGRARLGPGLVLVVALTAATYGPTLDHEFQYDDLAKVAWTDRTRDPSAFLRAFGTGHYSDAASRLLPNVTLALDYALFGPDPLAYHLTNLVLHLLNITLVALWGRALLRRAGAPDDAVALLGAAIFAVHPLNSEAVNYCNARPNVMATTFYLCALLAVLRAQASPSERGRRLAWTAFGVSAALALLCKELSVTLVVAVPLVLWWLPRGEETAPRARRALLAAGGGLLLAALLVGVATGALFGAYDSVVRTGSAVAGHWLTYEAVTMLDQSEVFLRYFGLALVPWPGFLSIDHGGAEDSPARLFRGGHAVEGALGALRVPLASFALLLIALRIAFARRRRAPVATFLVLWPFVTHAVNSLVPGDEPMVEYRTYLPMVGICLAFALALRRMGTWLDARAAWPSRPFVRRAGWAALVLVLVAGTAVRNRAWATSETMWEDAARKSPSNPRAQNNLGSVLKQLGRFDAALARYRRAAELKPAFPEADMNLGMALARRGDVDGALQHYARAVALAPDRPEALVLLGKALVAKGRVEDAVGNFRRALSLFPADPEARFELGKALSYRGDYDGAIRELERAVRLDPSRDEARAYLDELRRITAPR